jgi:hypothetical protein
MATTTAASATAPMIAARGRGRSIQASGSNCVYLNAPTPAASRPSRTSRLMMRRRPRVGVLGRVSGSSGSLGRNSQLRPGTKKIATNAASWITWTLPVMSPSMNGGHSSSSGMAGQGTASRRQVQIATTASRISHGAITTTRGRPAMGASRGSSHGG